MLTDAPRNRKTNRDDMDKIWNMCPIVLTDAPPDPRWNQ